jgi:hypothetical protein
MQSRAAWQDLDGGRHPVQYNTSLTINNSKDNFLPSKYKKKMFHSAQKYILLENEYFHVEMYNHLQFELFM